MGSDDETRLIDVPGTVTSGSLNNIAVAGIVRGTINPESAPNPELNTAITIAPGKPETNSATSDATDSTARAEPGRIPPPPPPILPTPSGLPAVGVGRL